MTTRDEDLQAHRAQVQTWREELRQTKDLTKRADLQRKLDAAPTVEQHIGHYWDTQDAKRTKQEARQQEAAQRVVNEQEAAIRRTLRSRWPGDDTSFDRAWPQLLEQFRMDRALGRAEPEPSMRPKAVI